MIQIGERWMMKIEKITMESIDNRWIIACQDSGPPVTALLDTLYAMTRRANAPEEMDDDVSELPNELLVATFFFECTMYCYRLS